MYFLLKQRMSELCRDYNRMYLMMIPYLSWNVLQNEL